MPLRTPQPPESVIAALRASDLVPAPDTPDAVAHTHSVFEIAAASIPGGDPDRDAISVGWRHIAHTDAGAVAARVRPGPSGRMQVVEISSGESAANTVDAVAAAQRLPEGESGDYELRLLTSQGLNLRMLWLKNETGGSDRFIPIPPAPRRLYAGRSYTWDDVQERLRTALRAPARAAKAPLIRSVAPERAADAMRPAPAQPAPAPAPANPAPEVVAAPVS